MEEMERQREVLETSILQEQIKKPPITREQIPFWFDRFRHGNPADLVFQEKDIDCFVCFDKEKAPGLAGGGNIRNPRKSTARQRGVPPEISLLRWHPQYTE